MTWKIKVRFFRKIGDWREVIGDWREREKKRMSEIRTDIPDQSYTLGCMIRRNLFDHGASFASCIVPHPQDTFLRVTVQHENPYNCIELALGTAEHTIDTMLKTVDAHQCHIDADNMTDTSSD